MDSDNVTCPVCTLYLRSGITLEQHLQTHPKDRVIEALVSLTNKKTSEIVLNGDKKSQYGDNQFVNSKTYTQAPWHQNRMVVTSPQAALPLQTGGVANNQSIFYQQFMASTGTPNFPVNTMVPQYVSIPHVFNQHMLMNPCVYQQQQQVQIVSGPLVPLGRTFDTQEFNTPVTTITENVIATNSSPAVPLKELTQADTSSEKDSNIFKKDNEQSRSVIIAEIANENLSNSTPLSENETANESFESPVLISKTQISNKDDDYKKENCNSDSFEVIFDKISQNPDLEIAKTNNNFHQSEVSKEDDIVAEDKTYMSVSNIESSERITPDNEQQYEYLENSQHAQTVVSSLKPLYEPTPEDFTNSILPHLSSSLNIDLQNERENSVLSLDQLDHVRKGERTNSLIQFTSEYIDEKSNVVDTSEAVISNHVEKYDLNESDNCDVIILKDEIIKLPSNSEYNNLIIENNENSKIVDSEMFNAVDMTSYDNNEISSKGKEIKSEKTVLSFTKTVPGTILTHSDMTISYGSTESMNVVEFDGMKLVIPGELINTKAPTAQRNFHCGDNMGEKSPVLLNIGDINKSPYVVEAEGQEESVSAESLNIRANERMPPKGELSEQESNGASESGWGREGSSGMSTSYDLLARESWEASDCSDTEVPPLQSRVPLMNCYTNETKNLAPPNTPPRYYKCCVCNESFLCPKERRVHQAKEHGTDNQHTVIRSLKSREHKIIKIKSENNEMLGDFENSFEAGPTKVEIDYEANAKIGKSSTDTKDFEMTLIKVQCRVCNVEFASMKLLQRHHKAVHKEEPVPKYKCAICNEAFAAESKYTEHLRIHPLECSVCGKYFYRRQNMQLHLKRHFGIKPFKCEMCKKSFITKQKLNEHLNCHTGNTPIKCNLCDETFRRHSNLIQHRNTHHFHLKKKYKDFVCHCGEVFHSKKKFLWHNEIHDLKPKACAHCNEKFIHIASLTRHMRKAHNHHYVPDEKRKSENVECNVCKGIYLRSSLEVHMKTHTGVKPYTCNICNKVFSTKWNLKLHRWTHASRASKPFKCNLCKSAFIRQPDYTAHMNSHRSVRPYTCNYCGRQFIRKYNCQRHVKEHEQDKSFSCSVCGKTFHRSYYLKEHLRIHSGARPFSCHICGKMSATKSNHNKHVRIHHAREPVSTEG